MSKLMKLSPLLTRLAGPTRDGPNTSFSFNFGNFTVGDVMDRIKIIFEKIEKLDYENCSWLTNRDSCEGSPLYRTLMGYCFPILLITCLFGNSMNILVYSSRNMRRALAVKILASKAVMNTLFVLSLIPNASRIIWSWAPNSNLEFLYWSSWPYLLFSANFFGSCAMWITVVMTLERFLYVTYPIRSRQWCTLANYYKCLALIVPSSFVLQLVYPTTRTVSQILCGGNYYYQFKIRKGSWYAFYDRMYHWVNLSMVIVVPLLCLTFMSVMISIKLLHRPNVRLTDVKLSQYRCITRITLSTTLAQLIFETPAVGVFISAALYGPQVVNSSPSLCVTHALANFLALCNSSVLFIIYLLLSVRFRHLFLCRICCRSTDEQEFVSRTPNFNRDRIRMMLMNTSDNNVVEIHTFQASNSRSRNVQDL